MHDRLAYFPEIYPNELFYSVIARYAYHTGYNLAHKLNGDLFGRKGGNTSFDLPTDLSHFCSKLPSKSNYTPIEIIKNHSLYRYYVSFTDDDYRIRAASAMMHPQEIGLKATVRRQSIVGALSRLRFCQECQVEMIENHGEYYWKANHQLPLGLVCHRHNIVLHESTVIVGRNLQNYQIPTDQNCVASEATTLMPRDDGLWTIIRRITDESVRHQMADQPQDMSEFAPSLYTSQLKDLGFMIGGQYSNFESIEKRANQHFIDLTKFFPSLTLKGLNRESWFMLPTRKLKSNVHPLYHILLKDFIGNQTSQEITTSGAKFWRSSNRTWPCHNPLVNHQSKPKITVTNHYTFQNYTSARFKCECGYSYTIKRDNNGDFSPPTISEFGPSLRPFLQKAAEMGWSARRAAKELGIKGATLTYQAKLLGIDFATMKRIKPPPTKRRAKP